MIYYTKTKSWRMWQLLYYVLRYPHYQILLADDADYPGTNWTDEFHLVVRHDTKTLCFHGECT